MAKDTSLIVPSRNLVSAAAASVVISTASESERTRSRLRVRTTDCVCRDSMKPDRRRVRRRRRRRRRRRQILPHSHEKESRAALRHLEKSYLHVKFNLNKTSEKLLSVMIIGEKDTALHNFLGLIDPQCTHPCMSESAFKTQPSRSYSRPP